MVDVSEFKKVAIDAVQKAEERILYYFHHHPKVETKVDKTPVTKADKKAEDIIVSTIRKAFPQHGYMGEELGTVSEPTTLNNAPVHVSKIADLSHAFINCSPTGLDDECMVNLLRAVDQKVLNMRGFGDTYGYHHWVAHRLQQMDCFMMKC